MKAKSVYATMLVGCVCFACKPEGSEVVIEPGGRLVKEVKKYSAANRAVDINYVFSYDANGEVLQVRVQSDMGTKIVESRYDYSRVDNRLSVAYRGSEADIVDYMYEFELDGSGHIRFDRNHAGVWQDVGISEPRDWEYRYQEGYAHSAMDGENQRFEYRWNDGDLTEETWFIGNELSVREYEYLDVENKTNIDILSLVGATLGRPGTASPDTRVSLFYFGGKKSRNLPVSYSVSGMDVYRYSYTYDSQGCPVRIECRDVTGILQTTWEITY